MARRVVITGLGTINPLAGDVQGFWEGLRNGRSGIGTIERFDVSGFKVRFGGEVNAHATRTPRGDLAEDRAIKRCSDRPLIPSRLAAPKA